MHVFEVSHIWCKRPSLLPSKTSESDPQLKSDYKIEKDMLNCNVHVFQEDVAIASGLVLNSHKTVYLLRFPCLMLMEQSRRESGRGGSTTMN